MAITEQDVRAALQEIVDPNTGQRLDRDVARAKLQGRGRRRVGGCRARLPGADAARTDPQARRQRLRALPGVGGGHRQRDGEDRRARRAARRQARARREEHHRRRFGERRGGQIDDRGQPRARPRGRRRRGRRARCRYLRPIAADDARHRWTARIERWQAPRADGRPWHPGDLDRVSHRRRHADGLARADGDAGAGAVAQGHQAGAIWTTSSSIFRPAPATSSSHSRRRFRSPARIIVTTPQDIALIDARKGLKMFEKVGIPILGMVENMATHVCSNCGHEEHIFGSGGAAKMCQDYKVELLGVAAARHPHSGASRLGQADRRRRPRRPHRRDLSAHRSAGGGEDR